jgi:hypothetical protein
MQPEEVIFDADTGLERHNFRDRKLELFVWSRNGAIAGYELHYAIRTAGEWSVRWSNDQGTTFNHVDYGRRHRAASAAMVPIETSIAERTLPIHDLHVEFAVCSRGIDERFRNFVLRHLSQLTRRAPV